MRRLSSRSYMRSRKHIIFGVLGLVAAALALNWVYQVVRKPAELFFPVSGALFKTPTETWQHYEPIFRRHSTAVMTPELLAALAQVEGSGNPVARTPWRLRASSDPREVYRPASSAVGMYQITDGTFREAKRYCIRDNAVLEDGCWFNSLYMRVIPSHAVELTSAYLDRRVAMVLERHRLKATLEQKQDLAAIIHLCGAAAGDSYARRGFRLAPGQRCGEHDPRAYLARVNAMKRVFARLSTFR
ncbi:MAG TPA: transglycosylase SLT domain-containing protein [Burkholderiales bacterium]